MLTHHAQHLDIPAACLSQSSLLDKAMKELHRMDEYKAPRDKMICVMNCCKLVNAILVAAAESDAKTGEWAARGGQCVVRYRLCQSP